MEINERFIQISGKIETDKDLKHGDDVKVLVTVIEITDQDNQDGTFDRVYKAKLLADD